MSDNVHKPWSCLSEEEKSELVAYIKDIRASIQKCRDENNWYGMGEMVHLLEKFPPGLWREIGCP